MRWGAVFAGGYLLIFMVAAGLGLYDLHFHTERSELSAVPAILVTIPWCYLTQPLERALGYIQWYGQFSSRPLLYGFFAMLGLVPAAAINTVIFYALGRYLERSSSGSSGGT